MKKGRFIFFKKKCPQAQRQTSAAALSKRSRIKRLHPLCRGSRREWPASNPAAATAAGPAPAASASWHLCEAAACLSAQKHAGSACVHAREECAEKLKKLIVQTKEEIARKKGKAGKQGLHNNACRQTSSGNAYPLQFAKG